jgi:ribA/ribD-fused uncharacterized protein
MKTPFTLDTLIDSIQGGLIPKWLFFWGHKPSEDGSVTKSCFSQWWAGHPFVIDDLTYPTAEHYMMAEKARLFGDTDSLKKILIAKSAAEAKKLGRTVTNFNDSTWVAARSEIVVQGNFAKFYQHPKLRAYLAQTGDRVRVEASPFDRIWGIGMAVSHTNAEDPTKWNGLNLLGFALMEVRERLRLELNESTIPTGSQKLAGA